MFIETIKPLNGLNENQINKTNEQNNNLSFKSILGNAVNSYIESENQVDKDIYELSTGQSDDLHNLMINTQKAELSLELMLQLRNKALDAYNEIMNTSV
jgi:flagellar hook-basal body complex protein FliE